MRRALLLEGRRFIEEPEEDLTIAEALRLGADALREVGDGDPQMEKAARMLDKKAMKARAREEATLVLPELCLCGNTKANGARFCRACEDAIPMQLWLNFHTAPLREMGRAYREIEEIVRARGGRGRR